MTRNAGHHRVWGAKNATKTNVSSALVRSMGGNGGSDNKDGAGENGHPKRVFGL